MELNSEYIIPTAIIYGILMCCLWGLDFVGAWVMWQKIVLTIAFIPICYIIISVMANR